ncbi:uncharacterized protein JCM6883_003391 [Sporobolomyces salmoneus]|uniref:uncharacterized protein n=1 Tax=Sporobolomyces salmoneus TaxID=183962 RepID=UPI0031729408
MPRPPPPARRLNGRPIKKKEWTQEHWDSHNLDEIQYHLDTYSDLQGAKHEPCTTPTCNHKRDRSINNQRKTKRVWANKCAQCEFADVNAPERKAKRKISEQKIRISKGSEPRYVAPRINVGINLEWYKKNQHDHLYDDLGSNYFGDGSDSEDEAEEKEAKRLRRRIKEAAPNAGGLRTTYYQHPDDPSLEIPIPTMDPTYPHLPLVLDSIPARNNFRRIAGAHAEHLAETAWQEPSPAKCHHEGCDLDLDRRKGDHARCSIGNRDGVLYVRYGDRRGIFCRQHYNEVGAVIQAERKRLNPEHERTRGLIVNAAPLTRARYLARSLLFRQKEHETDLGVTENNSFLAFHNNNNEDCYSAIVRLYLELPGNGGSMSGDLLRRPGFNPRDKKFIAQKFKEFERDAQCFTCKRKLTTARGQDARNCDLPSIDRLDSSLDYANSKQTLRLSCLGCQFGQGDLSPNDRSNFLVPLLDNMLDNAALGNSAAEYLELALLKEETKIEPHQEIRMKELREVLEESGRWSERDAKEEWSKRLKHNVDLETKRKFVEGRPGKVEFFNGKKVLNRQAWARGGTFDENMAKAEKFVIATGGMCPIFSVPTQPIRKADGSYQGMLSLTLDRIADDGWYDYDNVMPMLQSANKFKSSLPVFRTRARIDAFFESQPSLKKIVETRGFKAAVAHYLRLEIAGVWRDENELDEEEEDDEDEVDGEMGEINEEEKDETETLPESEPSTSSKVRGKKPVVAAKSVSTPRISPVPPPPVTTRPRLSSSSALSLAAPAPLPSTSNAVRTKSSKKPNPRPPPPAIRSPPSPAGRIRSSSSFKAPQSLSTLLSSTSKKAPSSEKVATEKRLSPSRPSVNSTSPFFPGPSSSTYQAVQSDLKEIFGPSLGRASTSGGGGAVDSGLSSFPLSSAHCGHRATSTSSGDAGTTLVAANMGSRKTTRIAPPTFQAPPPAKRPRSGQEFVGATTTNRTRTANTSAETSSHDLESTFENSPGSVTDTSREELYPDSFCEGGEYESYGEYEREVMDFNIEF